VESDPAAETQGDYEIGYCKPPGHAGFQKGQSGNPKGRQKGSKNLATLLSEALDEKVSVTEDGRRRRVTKREAVITQLVNKSASAELRAIKQLTDIVEGVERRAGTEPAPSRHRRPLPPRRTRGSSRISRPRWSARSEPASRTRQPEAKPISRGHDGRFDYRRPSWPDLFRPSKKKAWITGSSPVMTVHP
jgi:Family of unknown function (DUF5681)